MCQCQVQQCRACRKGGMRVCTSYTTSALSPCLCRLHTVINATYVPACTGKQGANKYGCQSENTPRHPFLPYYPFPPLSLPYAAGGVCTFIGCIQSSRLHFLHHLQGFSDGGAARDRPVHPPHRTLQPHKTRRRPPAHFIFRHHTLRPHTCTHHANNHTVHFRAGSRCEGGGLSR